MAENDRIAVWVRMRDIARFRRDAKNAADDIKNIGDQAGKSRNPLNQLGGAMSEMFSNIPQWTGRTRIFGFAVGTVVTALTAVIPLAVGLGGALVAVAGSAGAAALGAGALGVALAGAAIPLGGFGLVLADAITGFDKIKDATARYELAVASFGRESTQAETALMRLNGTIELFGGRPMQQAVEMASAFADSWRKEVKPAMGDIARIFIMVLEAGKRLLPVFSDITNQAAEAIRGALGPALRELSGPEVQGILKRLGDAFSLLAGPLIRSATNFLIGLLQIASRVAPSLQWLAGEVENASVNFRQWATSGNLGILIDHFQQWWDLTKAVGGLLVTIFSSGASDGKNLVETLTGIVNKWNEFLSTTEGQDSLRSFFGDAVKMTKAFVTILAGVIGFLFAFGRAFVPIYTVAFKALSDGWGMVIDAFRPAQPLWDNVLRPFLEGLVGGILGGVVGAFRTVIGIIRIAMVILGFLARPLGFLQGAFRVLGWVIGFFFGGWVLRLIAMIGRVNILLRPLGALFRLLAVPINLAGRMVGFLLGRFAALLGVGIRFAAQFLPPIRNAIDRVLAFLAGSGARLFDAGARLWRWVRDGLMRAIGSGIGFAGDIGRAVYNWVAQRINSVFPNEIDPPGPGSINLPDNPLPLLASGGVVSGTGSWITGEMGPELNTLTSAGKVVVKPLAPGIAPISSNATLDPGGGKVLVSKVYLRGRQIAEAVADEADDEITRTGGS